MGDLQIKKQPKVYDVVIVGSGAGGGMAAYTLANAGLKVCLLEAGPMYDPAKNVTQLKNPWESPRRGASTKFRPFGDFDASYWGWEIDGEPYTKESGTQWDWWRARMLGGRTNHWGRISLRFGPKDFKGKSNDGLGDDWPIGYEDVKPYYDKVDRLLFSFHSRCIFHSVLPCQNQIHRQAGPFLPNTQYDTHAGNRVSYYQATMENTHASHRLHLHCIVSFRTVAEALHPLQHR